VQERSGGRGKSDLSQRREVAKEKQDRERKNKNNRGCWRAVIGDPCILKREDLALSTLETYLPAACPSDADGHGQGTQEISEQRGTKKAGRR